MNPVYGEVLKFLLTTYFTAASQAGLSEEQREEYYNKQKAEFNKRKPEDLPDV